MKLKIKALSTEDLGTFKCMVKNIIGEKEGLIRLYGKSSPPPLSPPSNLKWRPTIC